MSDERRIPDVTDALSKEDLIDLGAALAEIRGTRGFRMILRLMRERERQLAVACIDDKAERHDYWRGRVEEARSLEAVVTHLIESAQELKAADETERGIFRDVRMGGGDLAS